jgi:ParB family transcriptional regulator, chromosome partitioning protein
MARPTGLGRGLGALLSEDAFEDTISNEPKLDEEAIALSSIDGQVLDIDIGQVDTFQDQPRKKFDEEKLEELANSIKVHGVVQPIIVRKNGDRFTIIAGERRYRASRIARLKSIPAIVKDIDSKEQMEISIIENLQREDLNPLEEAAAIKLLMTQYNLNQEKVAERIGKSRSAIANTLRLLQLPEKVRLMVFEGHITSGHAKCIGGLETDDDKIFVAKKAADDGMSVRETEKFVKKFNKIKHLPEGGSVTKEEPAPEVVEVESQLSESLETKVKLSGNFDKGKIVIEYYSKEQLDGLYNFLSRKNEDLYKDL